MPDIQILKDPQAVAAAAGDLFVNAASQAKARFTVAFPGGSTPKPLYERLASYNVSALVDWSQVHVFFGDERAVSPQHDDSNYGAAQATLLAHVPIAVENIHRIRGELGAEEAAIDYGRKLKAFFEGGAPAIDLHILGMGDDGHTASLFPGVLDALHETHHRAVATGDTNHNHARITMTPWAINSAAHVLVLVTGAHKAEMLHRVLDGPHQPDLLPIQHIQPQGRFTWLVDEAAAAHLVR